MIDKKLQDGGGLLNKTGEFYQQGVSAG